MKNKYIFQEKMKLTYIIRLPSVSASNYLGLLFLYLPFVIKCYFSLHKMYKVPYSLSECDTLSGFFSVHVIKSDSIQDFGKKL